MIRKEIIVVFKGVLGEKRKVLGEALQGKEASSEEVLLTPHKEWDVI